MNTHLNLQKLLASLALFTLMILLFTCFQYARAQEWFDGGVVSSPNVPDDLLPYAFTAYTNTWWGGYHCYNDYLGAWNMDPTCDDLVSSISLNGRSVRVYRDPNQSGPSVCINYYREFDLTYATYDDNSGLNDTISSYYSYTESWCGGSPSPAWPLEVYNHPDYSGSRCYSWVELSGDIHTDCHDLITSVLLRPGWSVRFYKDTGKSGPSQCIAASDTNLTDNYFDDGSTMNDSISSYMMYSGSMCGSTPTPTITLTPMPTTTPTSTLTPTPTHTPTPTPTQNTPTAQKVYLPLAMRSFTNYFEGIWEKEDNDSAEQANGPLLLNTTYFGYPDDVRDYFSFNLDTAANVAITLNNHSGSGVQLLVYYQSPGNNIGRDWQSPYQIEIANAQPGLYYVFIYTESGWNGSIAYQLRISR